MRFLAQRARVAGHPVVRHPLFAVAVLAACTTHHRLDRTPVFAGEDVTLRVAGQAVPARSVQVGERIAYQAPSGRVYDYQEIDTIVVRSRLKGALQGLGLGALGGGLVGAVLGYSSGSNSDCSDDASCSFNLSKSGGAFVFGLAFGAVGGLLGLVVGAASGATDIYDRPKPAVTLVGPAGSVAGVTVSF